MTKRKRLFFDIETAPNICLVFQTGHKINIDSGNIIKERAIICICWKWEDSKEVFEAHWDAKQNDKTLLQKFIKVANEADELVGHNGDRFDLAWIRTRCLYHGIDIFPKYITIDTLKVARQSFKFNSNKLNYIADFLGLGQKIKTDFSLWKNIVLHKDKKAMENMIKYCKKDVELLEKVFKVLNNHIPAKTHFGVVFNQDRGSCPECGSNHITRSKKMVRASGIRVIQMRCCTCGKHHTKTDK